MTLRPVEPDSFPDQWYLYSVLRSRMLEPDYNISHVRLPSWEGHVAFLTRDPYRWWDIIVGDKWYERCGVAYVTKNNEVGIWVAPNFRHLGLGTKVVEQYKKQALQLFNQAQWNMEMETPFLLANINPKNEPSQAFFRKHGFRLITQASGKDGMMTFRWDANENHDGLNKEPTD
jgi:RimJ/RimL family protein N-acetyltransferase